MGTSKRQRKQKHVHTPRRKGSHDHKDDALDLLEAAPEDLNQYEGSNALILPAKPLRKGAGSAGASAPAGPSKAELRKQRQVAQKRERREQVSTSIHQLQAARVTDEQLALLRPLHQRGVRETKRHRLTRALRLQRAGVASGLEHELLRERGTPGSGSEGDSGCALTSDEGSSGDEGEPARRHGAPSAQGGAAAAAATARAAAAPGIAPSAVAADDAAAPPAKKPRLADLFAARSAQPPASAAAAAAAPFAQGPATTEAGAGPGGDAEARRQMAQLAREEAQRARAAAGGTEEEAEAAAFQQRQREELAAARAAGPHRVRSVVRPPAMEEARGKLPILGMEQEVMEAVGRSDVVVLCGETGCGKTTQVPQFLLEAGYGCKDFPERAGAVGVTQPRRVAAISTAERVAAELGSKLGHLVGYQVRYDRRLTSSTSLAFMTDGILLRQLQDDFLLNRYSALVVDEAHERSLNTDLLLGMLSRVVPLRRTMHEEWVAGGRQGPPVYPLKLLIMSATLRTEDFTGNARLFPRPPPVLHIPARQFPVTLHFARHTELHDYVGSAFRKVVRIHTELPPGGVLVFLTGQREVDYLVRRLREHFAPKQRPRHKRSAPAPSAGAAAAAGEGQPAQREQAVAQREEEEAAAAAAGADGGEGTEGGAYGADAGEAVGALGAEASALAAGAANEGVDDYELAEMDEEEEEVQVLGGDQFTPEEIAAAEARFEERYGLRSGVTAAPPGDVTTSADAGGGGGGGGGGGVGVGEEDAGPAPVHVLPLYAMLPQALQSRVFRPPPAGHRLIVVATNVAETSLTIPGIRYVVDAGRSKQKLLEAAGGLNRYEVRWVSSASAEQRAGRAGRTGPGHCYRLYSSAVYNDTFPRHTPPEIANTPLEGVALMMRAMGVDRVERFPFPTPPEPAALASALACLEALGAVEPSGSAGGGGGGALTPLGRAMAVFPISPRHSRMLLEVALWRARRGEGAEDGLGAVGDRGVGVGGEEPPPPAAAERALPYAVALAAALSSESPFVHTPGGSTSAGVGGAGALPAGGKDAALQEAADKAERRRTAAAASAAHSQLRSAGDGDAIGALRALCAFLEAGESDAWAQQRHLHGRHLREMAELRRQLAGTLAHHAGESAQPPGASEARPLLRLLSRALSAGGAELAAPLGPPDPAVVAVLRRALAAGWADQVSRRVRSEEYMTQLRNQDGGHKRHAVRYESCGLDEPVYLHPLSCLHSAAPTMVVYSQLVQGAKRPYMACVTPIDPEWLPASGTPLARASPPLDSPPPFYHTGRDGVLAWHEVAYGRHGWALPRVARPLGDAAARRAVFAAALLAGRVLPALAALERALVAPAATAARTELRGLPRVGQLLASLESRQVDSRASLAAAWQHDPTFLQSELAAWVARPSQRQLLQLWPRLVQQAARQATSDGKTKEGKKSGGGSKWRRA